MSVPTEVPNGNGNPHDSGGSNLVCLPCWLASQGGTMNPAATIFGGQALCFDHLTKVYDALEAQPDVTPHV